MNQFDRIIPREGTAAVKYDGRTKYFANPDVIPLWIADMDFAVPEAVSDALTERAAHAVFGYTAPPESLFEALMEWLKIHHEWQIERDWIVLCPGVVPALHAVVLGLAQPREGVIVQPPVYFPFFTAVTTSGRTLLQNPLREKSGHYAMDYEEMERLASDGARLLILCSPHNPVGRVWTRDELTEVLRIANRHDLTILSDEIHADLVYPEFAHHVLAKFADNSPGVVTAVAPSKTFNIPGLGLSALIVPCPQRRQAIQRTFEMLHVSASNPFSIVAFEAAYRGGRPWLGELMAYLAQTRDLVRRFLADHLPSLGLIEPEGTYLLWLDCRAMQLRDEELHDFFVKEAGVGMSPGTLFGEGGSGFMRMNIGAPRTVIFRAMEQIASAYRRRGYGKLTE